MVAAQKVQAKRWEPLESLRKLHEIVTEGQKVHAELQAEFNAKPAKPKQSSWLTDPPPTRDRPPLPKWEPPMAYDAWKPPATTTLYKPGGKRLIVNTDQAANEKTKAIQAAKQYDHKIVGQQIKEILNDS